MPGDAPLFWDQRQRDQLLEAQAARSKPARQAHPVIPMGAGHPDREKVIQKDEVTDLRIALETDPWELFKLEG